jgi:integrase
MPHVRRPTYTRPIPATAEPCQVSGKPGVRWKGRRGQWVYGVLSRTPGRCLVRATRFHVFYTDHENRPTREKGYADRGAAEHRMRELATTAERIHAGLLDHRAARPRLGLSELLERWRRYIAASGAQERGARRQWQQAAAVCDGIGAVRVSDISPTAVLEWLDDRRRANRHGKRAFGPSTAATYLAAVKAFTRWCALVERCEPTDHLSAVKVRRDESATRHNRRALLPAELDRLLATTRRSEVVVLGLTGPERHALYLTACSTGFRASELARLGRHSFDLAAGEVTIDRPAKGRGRRADTLPVPPQVLRAVKPLLSRPGPLWPNRGARSLAWWHLGAQMLRVDLEAAGIPYAAGGRVFDFHALRGQFGTDLDRAGVSLTRAQKLMRHSDPRLTAKRYQRPDLTELASEVGKLRRGKR